MSAALVDVGDARLACETQGETGRPWIVLSNSLGADLSMWDAQMATLARTHRVLRYDTRGHGRSSLGSEPVTMSRLVADVVALLDHFEVGRADVMGLSLGGMTALGLGLDHPQRVRRLVCAACRADTAPAAAEAWTARIAAAEAGGMAAVAETTLERWFTPATRAQRPEMVDRVRAAFLATPVKGYAACAEAIKHLAYGARLRSLSAPTLFVAGEADVAAPPEVMRGMADASPLGTFEIIQEAAHLINIEQAGIFDTIVSRFLAAPI
jgi:3-oxoadipate enol-lactonase